MTEAGAYAPCTSGKPHHFIFSTPQPGSTMVLGCCKHCRTKVEAPAFLDVEHNPRAKNYNTLSRVGLDPRKRA